MLQAVDRGLLKQAKILVSQSGREILLELEAIDRVRTLPNVVFAGYSIAPPPQTEQQALDSAVRLSLGQLRLAVPYPCLKDVAIRKAAIRHLVERCLQIHPFKRG